MGEITEALRRARSQRGADRERRSQGAEAPPDTAVARAGLEALPPAPLRDPAPLAPPQPASAVQDASVATISRSRTELWPARAVLLDPREPHTERFRRFAIRVREELEQRQRRSLLVTSGQRSEGKTFTACNLALALASLPVAGQIALLELDLRRPSASAALGVTPRTGIEEVISGAASLADARMRTDLASLDLYLVRNPSQEAHQLLAHPRLAQMLLDLERTYDAVIVDSPPVLLVPDVSMILSHLGGCIVVLRAGSTRMRNTRDMLYQLPNDKMIGVFANDVTLPRNAKLYSYYAAEEDEQ
jgi:Mrp family chromosome partitioning ATPase